MTKKKALGIILILFIVITFFFILNLTRVENKIENNPESKINKTMIITSPAFKNNEKIPSKFTCNGEGVNPPLEFSEVPETTKSLVLIVDDPDAPGGDWVHWVVANIDPSVKNIKENSVPKGGVTALNSSAKSKYDPPCPPTGTHRYFFKLYALNKLLSINREVDKNTLLNMMQTSIIAQAELIGLYSQK